MDGWALCLLDGLFLLFSPEGFAGFVEGHGGQSGEGDFDPRPKVEGGETKGIRKEGDVNNNKLEEDTDDDSSDEVCVGQKTDLGEGLVVVADGEGKEELGHGQCQEAHGASVGDDVFRKGHDLGVGHGKEVVAVVHDAQVEGEEGDSPYGKAAKGNAEASPVGKKSLVGVSGTFLHDFLVSRVDPEGDSGKAIGDQIDPENLGREKGYRPDEEDGG